MVTKLLIAAALVGIVLLLIKIAPKSKYVRCERCEGNGFWRGLRGERNPCKQCGGTGEVPREA